MQVPLEQLEASLRRRNPLLVEHRMQAGLSKTQIEKELEKANIGGAIGSIVALYNWHDGCSLHGEPDNGLAAGFVPPLVRPLDEGQKAFLLQIGVKRDTETISYHFVPLKKAVSKVKSFLEIAPKQPRFAPLKARYFPFLWNGSTWWLAADTEPVAGGRIVCIETQETKNPHLLRHAYDTFAEFLEAAIEANEKGQLLSCIRNPGKPVMESASESPTAGLAAAEEMPGGRVRIPLTDKPLIFRTDYTNDSAWESLCARLSNTDDELSAELQWVNDPSLADMSLGELAGLVPKGSPHCFVLVVDKTSLSQADHPIMVLDLKEQAGKSFRAVCICVGQVTSNLSTGNMDFAEFAGLAAADGVFRGVG